MTANELTALLRANPAAAIEAVKAARIAGPRVRGLGGSSHRYAIQGWIGVASVSVREGGWYTYAPNRREPQYTGEQVDSVKGEPLEAFTARADELWRAAGWILVDEVNQ